MNRSWLTIIAITLGLAVTACGPDELAHSSDEPKPLTGLVPPPRPLANSYAECLRAAGVTVKEVIGVWVVAQDTVPDTLELAQGTCSKKHKDLLSSVGAIDDGSRDEASDEPGETLFFGLLNCMGAAGINLDRDTALFDSSASPAATAQFEDCIAKLRSFSSSTEPVFATDPPAAPLGV